MAWNRKLKAGDWVIFDFNIVQIKRVRDKHGYDEVSDGNFNTSGRLADRYRALTLRNKRLIEWFDWHYKEIDKINGHNGFNHPDIFRHFCWLCLRAIDGSDDDQKPFNEAREFLEQARAYKPTIQGVKLFREAA